MSLEGAVATLGNPAEWPEISLRKLVWQKKDTGHPELELLGVSVAVGVRPRWQGDNRPAASLDLNAYKHVLPGEIVMNALGKPHGSIGRSAQEGITSPAYWVLECTEQADSRFLHYLLRSNHMVNEYQRIGKYLPPNQFDISWDLFRNITVPLPPLEEQRRIADFLDDQVGRIDQATALRTAQSDLVGALIKNSHQRAIFNIQHGPYSLAPAGQKWQEDLPQDWQTPTLSRLVSFRAGDFISADNIEAVGDFAVYGANGPRGFTNEFTNEGDTILVGRQGALCGNVHQVSGRFWASEHALVATPRVTLHLPWLAELLSGLNLGQYSVSAAQPGISVDRIKAITVPFPAFHEQIRIANELSEKALLAREIMMDLTQWINKITEHKRALITAATTGQMDVTSAKPLSDKYLMPSAVFGPDLDLLASRLESGE